MDNFNEPLPLVQNDKLQRFRIFLQGRWYKDAYLLNATAKPKECEVLISVDINDESFIYLGEDSLSRYGVIYTEENNCYMLDIKRIEKINGPNISIGSSSINRSNFCLPVMYKVEVLASIRPMDQDSFLTVAPEIVINSL